MKCLCGRELVLSVAGRPACPTCGVGYPKGLFRHLGRAFGRLLRQPWIWVWLSIMLILALVRWVKGDRPWSALAPAVLLLAGLTILVVFQAGRDRARASRARRESDPDSAL